MKKMRIGMLTALCMTLSFAPVAIYADSLPPASVTRTADDRPDVYKDVSKSDYYYDAVFWASELAITSGTDATHFSPKAACTRGQIVTFLWRSAGEPEANQSISFKDIDTNSDLAKAIRWAISLKLVSGYNDGSFRANDKVTREQLVSILYRYAQARKLDVSVGEDTNILSYNDIAEVSEYAIPAFQWACGSGIVSGSNGNLLPKKACSRAEVITMMYKLMADIGVRF